MAQGQQGVHINANAVQAGGADKVCHWEGNVLGDTAGKQLTLEPHSSKHSASREALPLRHLNKCEETISMCMCIQCGAVA